MHRDLKPQNIVYKDSDKYSSDVAIIDFGFATNVKYTEQVLSNCGTPGYAAPEIMEYKEK
jgi:serine/threonine protein kinase